MSQPTHTLRKPLFLADTPQQGQVALQVSQPETVPPAMRESPARDDTARDIDKDYLVRALSHDVGAHLMLLEFSFRHYDELAKRLISEVASQATHGTSPEHNSPPVGRVLRRDGAANPTPAPHTEPYSHHHGEPATQTSHLPPSPPSQEMAVLNEVASHVTACLDEMKRFVNELISFTKTGTIDMEPSAVNIAKVVSEVLFEQWRLIEKRKIDVVVSSPLPTVFANPTRIKQILTNLVRNAAIHGCDTVAPMIVIASEMVTHIKPGHGAMACFSVRDNGCGIPQEECDRIFEPGYRVPGNQNEGSGIGLAIVKKIACYYDGDAVCHSEPGNTTFSITLPKG